MHCCSECFAHIEIKKIIESISQKIGDCEFCGTKSIKIVDSREMAEFFQQPIDLYKPSEKGDDFLCDLIQIEWQIFNLNSEKINVLLSDMFSEESLIDPNLFSKKVINQAINSPKSKDLLDQWNNLKKEIVNTNRFFIENVIDLDLLEKYLKDKRKFYKSGSLFYRGRISKKEGIDIKDIGKPPVEKATSGRANPKGIPYLYLSTDKETTLYETRATYLDYVTIGTFELKEDVEIVKLRTVDILNPFEENLYEKIIYQPFLRNLEKELSRPLRRYESELEYLPTQYLCEFIKHIGLEGVEYGSAMTKSGVNVAFFEDSKFSCVNMEIVEVENIDIIINVSK